jgi:precorrin-6A/cobalt-precorrin-6A reductase
VGEAELFAYLCGAVDSGKKVRVGTERMKILILGGTAEARQLARLLVGTGHHVISSLAGRTQEPVLPEGPVRIGGFGGVEGLCAYLRAEKIEFLVDATHPYAGVISSNAVLAAEKAEVPLVRLLRPGWTPKRGQDWAEFATAQAAADALPHGSRVLLTTGHAGLETYLGRVDCDFLVRLIEPPDFLMPPHAKIIRTRPPYGLEGELALMRNQAVTHLISKNSGGGQTAAKLEAAHMLGVKVFMIARPIYRPATEVESVEAVLKAIEG